MRAAKAGDVNMEHLLAEAVDDYHIRFPDADPRGSLLVSLYRCLRDEGLGEAELLRCRIEIKEGNQIQSARDEYALAVDGRLWGVNGKTTRKQTEKLVRGQVIGPRPGETTTETTTFGWFVMDEAALLTYGKVGVSKILHTKILQTVQEEKIRLAHAVISQTTPSAPGRRRGGRL